MVISFGNNGQFGNAYLASAYLAAHAIEYGYPIHILNLAPYAHSLAMDSPVRGVRLGSSTLLRRIGVHASWVLGKAGAEMNSGIGRIRFVRDNGGGSAQIAEQGRNGSVFHFGWKFRDRDAHRKHIGTVRSLLRLRDGLVGSGSAKFFAMREDAKQVIAIHVRQGDYRNHRGGRYFFPHSHYQELAAAAVRSVGVPAREIRIMAFSNEPLDWPKTLGGAQVVTPAGTWWEDFICLSMSDLIIGPPSTFSGSASLQGDVPWFQIKDNDSPFDPTMARPYLESGIRV